MASFARWQDEREEIEAYKKSLRAYFESQGLVCVVFERNWRSQHMQLQVVPVPAACAPKLEATFRSVGQRHGIKFDSHKKGVKVEELLDDGVPFLAVELPGDGPLLLHCIDGRFPLQFGRYVAVQRRMGT